MKYGAETNALFLKASLLNLWELVKFKTKLIVLKARNNLLLVNIQNCLRTEMGVTNNLRKLMNFKNNTFVLKKMCSSIYGVDSWNRLDVFKQSKSSHVF